MKTTFWTRIARWPRWLRALMAWAAVLVSIPLMFYILDAIASSAGFSSCGANPTENGFWMCSGNGRIVLTLLTIGAVLPGALVWARFLQKLSSNLDSDVELALQRDPHTASDIESCEALPFRQFRLSGQIHTFADEPRHISIGNRLLTLASPRVVTSRAVRDGTTADIVYQEVPGCSDFRLVMAVRLTNDNKVHAIAARLQAFFTLIAFCCLIWFGWLAPRPEVSLAILSALLCGVSLLYLTLTLRATGILKRTPENAT